MQRVIIKPEDYQ